MIRLENILFPTDFSRCAEHALTHAVYLARTYQAELHVLHATMRYVGPPNSVAMMEEVEAELDQAARRRLTTLAEAHRAEGLHVRTDYQRGVSPAPVILDYVRRHDIDLVVMGTHGRRGLDHWLLGSVAEEVVRLSPCPVLTIRERKDPMPIEAIDRILVPIDFSQHSEHALAYAKQMAAVYDSGLQLLHVIEETPYPAIYRVGRGHVFDLLPEIEQKSRLALKKLVEESTGREVPASFHVIVGRAAWDITEFARENGTDLIVIATHGLTGIEHLLVGSVTEKVVRQSPCPVLTVKAFGKNLLVESSTEERATNRAAS